MAVRKIHGKIGAEESQRKSTARDTHWDFLDEIEAPMWVDLVQEAKLSYQDRDDGGDEWFNIRHPFHHCSSLESMSPKIPSSVLRSRGKDFRSRKWDLANKGDGNLSRPASVVSLCDNVAGPLGIDGSQSDDSCEKSCVTEVDVKHDQFMNTSESSCEGQRQTSSDFSSRLPEETSRFLSLLKRNMRKSYVTRQASRVVVTEASQSKGQSSSSSKSSVGSSSTNGCDGSKEVLQQSTHAKVLVPRSSTAATVKGRGKGMVASGRQISDAAKENFSRKNTRMRPSEDVKQVQKGNGRKLPENIAKTKLASQKEKLGRGGEGKSGTTVHQRAYYPRMQKDRKEP